MPAGDGLRRQLSAIEDARVAGDRVRAASLRRELVLDRLVDRVAAVEDGLRLLRPGDIELLIQAADDFARDEEYGNAMDLLRAAYEFSQAPGYRVLGQRATIHGIWVRCEMVDLVGASRELEYLLECPGSILIDDRALDAARNLVANVMDEAEQTLLRAEAIFAVARVWAAWGKLESADRALSLLLDLVTRRKVVGWLARDEIALLLAEIRIDRGDFAGFDSLSERETRVGNKSGNTGWAIVTATSLFLRGRLSEAREQLREIEGDESDSSSLGRRRRRLAQWQLAQVLSALNYQDDAEQTLHRFAAGGNSQEAETHDALFAARRRGAAQVMAPPPTPREIWFRRGPQAEIAAKSETSRTADAATDGRVPVTRVSERVHDDWAHGVAEVHLLLDRGNRGQAEARLRDLAWIVSVQSPLLHARFQRLSALVAYFDDVLVMDGTAELLAQQARNAFARLGLLVDEWDASRLRHRSLVKRDAPKTEIDDEARRAQSLLERIEVNLAPMDRRLFRLNKWSAIDDAIDGRIRRLSNAGTREPRAVLGVMREIAVMKRGTAPSRRRSGTTTEAEVRTGSDVFTWAHRQARANARNDGRIGERLRLSPALIRADTALVTYTALPSRLEAFLLHRGGCERLEIARPAGRREVFEAGRQALLELSRKTLWQDAMKEARGLPALGGMLGVEELARALPSHIRRIVIELDDVLVHLPFSAIPVAGVPLVERWEVAVTPYVRWTERRAGRGRSRSALGVAVTAPPYEIRGKDGAVWSFASLGDPTAELQSLWRIAHDVPQALQQAAATTLAVSTALRRVEVAHFICHGDYFANDSEPCKLMLWDRPLTVADLREADMRRLRFVALGACWSGNARILPGREIVGIPTEFLEHGATTVLSALWQLPDAEAAEFACAMYEVAVSEGFVAAINHVQRKWWKNKPTEAWALYQTYVDGIPARPSISLALAMASRVVNWSRGIATRIGRVGPARG